MSKTVEFSVYVSISGEVEVDEFTGNPMELMDAIFPRGWEGTIMDIDTNPQFLTRGYANVIDEDDEDDEEEED